MATVRQDYSLTTVVRGTGLPDRAVTAIEEIQRFLRERGGLAGGASDNQFVTLGSLLPALGNAVRGGGTIPGGLVEEAEDRTPPPAPAGLQAFGGYSAVQLRWTPNADRRIGFTEVWRASVNDIGQAVQIGSAVGNLYGDETQTAQTYFYWVRNVNRWDGAVKSAFNAVAGTPASTAPDLDYALFVLTGQFGAQPFYALSQATTIDGVTLQPGVYLKQSFTLDAIVRTFRAGLAIIDNANILNLAANKITSGALQVNTQITGGNWGSSGGTQGWAIDANGTARFNNVYVKGTVEASNIVGNTITGNTLTGNTISGETITGGTISGTTISGTNISGSNISGNAITGGSISGATMTAGSISGTNVSGGTFTGSFLRSADAQRWLHLDATTDQQHILMTPNAKIRGDGRTDFLTSVASGRYFVPAPLYVVIVNPALQTATGNFSETGGA